MGRLGDFKLVPQKFYYYKTDLYQTKRLENAKLERFE